MKQTAKVGLIILIALTIPLTIFSQDIGGVFTFSFAVGSAKFYEPFEEPEQNAPGSLPALENTTWEEVLAEAVTNFKKIPRQHMIEVTHTDKGGSAYYEPEVNDALINLISPETKQKIHLQMEMIMSDYQLQTDFYTWIKPHFLQAWRKLEPQDRGFYLQVASSLNQYVREMDYYRELYYLEFGHKNKWPEDEILEKYYREDYNSCYQPVNPNPHSKYQFSPSCNPAPGTEAWGFYLYDSYGKKTLHRKLHTWVFFQIHNGPMERWEWRYWLQTIHRDFLAESHKLGMWDIDQAPAQLPRLGQEGWQGLLTMGLASFFHNPYIYDDEECAWHPDFHRDATMVYGLLAPANFWGSFWEVAPKKTKIFSITPTEPIGKKEVLDTIFIIMRDKDLRKLTYNWIKEPYTQAFISLPAEYQQIYIDMLEHGEQYLPTYDYQAELAYYKKLAAEANQPTECESRDTYYAKHKSADYWDYRTDCQVPGFVYTNHNGEDREFPKLEAWYFRQIYNERMTLEELRYWNKKLLDDAQKALASTKAVRY